jgi:anthranilate/para-aminobenzoate synthase component I
LHQPIITNLHFPSQKVFNNQFSEVTHLIKEGQIYQINLTDKVTAESELTAEDWFSYIAYEFPKAHSCLFDLGGQQIISASPEMFLKIYPDSMITTEPIKGTAKSRWLLMQSC